MRALLPEAAAIVINGGTILNDHKKQHKVLSAYISLHNRKILLCERMQGKKTLIRGSI